MSVHQQGICSQSADKKSSFRVHPLYLKNFIKYNVICGLLEAVSGPLLVENGLAACFHAKFTQEQTAMTLAHGRDFPVYKATYKQVYADIEQ